MPNQHLDNDAMMMQARLSQKRLRFIKRRIELLKSTNLKKVDIEYLKENLFDLLGVYTSATISPDENTSIFRARKNTGTMLFDNVSELWYPPPPIIKRFGRVNNIGQAVFYCTTDDDIAILELRPALNDVITILECKPVSNNTPVLISLGIDELAKKYDVRIAGPPIEPDRIIKAWLGNRNHFQKNDFIGKFISDEFKKIVEVGNEYEYKMTVAMSELLLSFEGIEGITYPSIASGMINANIALLPRTVDRIYKPVACQVVKIVEKLGNSEFRATGKQAKCIGTGGQIEW